MEALTKLGNNSQPAAKSTPTSTPPKDSSGQEQPAANSRPSSTPPIEAAGQETKASPKAKRAKHKRKESSMDAWREVFVCEEIIENLARKGFQAPTLIQKMTLPAAMKGRMDIVGAAETGSGKTLAFGIPILQGIMNDKKRDAEGVQEAGDEDPDNFDNPPAEEEQIVDNTTSDNAVEADAEDEFATKDPSDSDTAKVDGDDKLEPAADIVENLEATDDNSKDLEATSDAEDDNESEADPKPKSGGALRALILTPTRELAIQIKDHIQAILANTGISICVIVGGMSAEKQERLLKRRPEIVVATPGRLWDLVQEGNPHLLNLSSLRYLAIDETDRMGEKGHFEELQKLLEMLKAEGVGRMQKFVMSATLSLVHKPPAYSKGGKKTKQKSSKEKLKELMEFVGVGAQRKVVDITRKVGTAESLTESVIHCETEEKDCYLYYFIKSHKGRTIVFCNSIDCVRRLSNLFSYIDCKPYPLHAQLHQKQRLKNLDRFTASEDGLLIATDVAARGLDIPNIQHVVHYQVPRTSESYIHRSGRTARASNTGLSVLLIDPSELYLYKKLCVTLNRQEDLPHFPVDGSRYARVEERMECARRLDKLLLEARKKSVEDNWFQKTAEEADLVLSDEDDSDDEKGQAKKASKVKAANTRRELDALLRMPLLAAGFGGRYPTMSGGLPHLEAPTAQQAVDVLHNELASTNKLLGKKNKATSSVDRKFKGFKKKKERRRNQAQANRVMSE